VTLLEKVLKILRDNEIRVLSQTETGSGCLICTKSLIIHVSDPTVSIAFCVDTAPDVAAVVTLLFSKAFGPENLAIGKVFFRDENNNILCGEDAEKKFRENVESYFLEKFTREQAENAVLLFSEPYTC